MANETTKVAPATKVKAKKEKPPKKKQTKGMKILTVIFSSIRLHCRMQKLFTDLRAILQVCSSVTSHFGKPFYAHFLLPLAVYF